jgi:uncharacterized small protein (DUF1192 family)
MLTFDERIENIEKGLVNINQTYLGLATFDELDAVIALVFDEIDDLQNRIVAVKNNIDIIEEIISTATG